MKIDFPTAKLPPGSQRQVIEEMLVLIPDPVEKLTLIKRLMGPYGRIPVLYRLYPRLMEVALRKKIIDAAEQIRPGSRETARRLMTEGTIPTPEPLLWRVYQLRHAIVALFILVFGWGMGSAVAALFDRIQPTSRLALETDAVDYPQPLASALALPGLSPAPTPGNVLALAPITPMAPIPPLASVAAQPSAEVTAQLTTLVDQLQATRINPPEYLQAPIWLVERKAGTEVYSNGLHIITRHTVANTPRQYLVHSRRANPAGKGEAVRSTGKIAGILYHAAESDLYPFHPEMNRSLKRYSAALIKYLKANKSYHYFIDRFGRVYRIVQEADAAHHAGNSIWADDRQFFLNLNHSFLGICFEGRGFETPITNGASRAGDAFQPAMVAMLASSLNSAQLQSGKVLTQWLRYHYGIRQHNCVPHGLASVNPDRFLIGHHLDMAHSFPFEQFGLSNKYRELMPSITEFGFTHDQYLVQVFRGRLWPGVHLSQRWVSQKAREMGVDAAAHRLNLQAHFRKLFRMEQQFKAARAVPVNPLKAEDATATSSSMDGADES